MTGREQIAIVRHVLPSVLKKRIKRHTRLPEAVPRQVCVRLRYTGLSVVQAAEVVEVPGQTDYNWQERRTF